MNDKIRNNQDEGQGTYVGQRGQGSHLFLPKFNKNRVGLIGDVDEDGTDYGEWDDEGMGDVEPVYLSQGDIDEIMSGAPVGRVVAKKVPVRTRPGSNPSQARKAIRANLAMPGRAISSAFIPALIAVNAEIVQFATKSGVSGALVKYNLDKHRVASPFTSVSKNATGAGAGLTTTVTLDAALIAPIDEFTVPMLFLTITASTLNARVGARYEITVTAVNEFLAAASSETWIIQRKKANELIHLTLIPFVRVKDTVTPVLGAFGTVQGVAKTFVVSVIGVDTSETVQVIAPGLDSQEMVSFLRMWNA